MTHLVIDLITSFGSKNLPSGKHMIKHTPATNPKAGAPTSSQEQRLSANRLRPTIARASVLGALEKAARVVSMLARSIVSSARNSTAPRRDRSTER
ncbi:hypothetical protein J2W28_005594 [Variovorax boronicumulans]|uniref:hypothetical protein n=1 Tax=Variovorax boronicumulans TaxID=436515 RepID=UPI002783BA24|nr:hypothetical protein [Variovorax boronicumulans]MDP9995133.1 hypothetical protein [Variovorax boronicumulans]MDQ0006423.1 hypothetical protein [Variovorax boronicumulans]